MGEASIIRLMVRCSSSRTTTGKASIFTRKGREKIAAIRQQERDGVYQRCLFAPDAKVEASFDQAFAFKEGDV